MARNKKTVSKSDGVQSTLEDFKPAVSKSAAFTTNMEKFVSDRVVAGTFDQSVAEAYAFVKATFCVEPLGKAVATRDSEYVKKEAGAGHSTCLWISWSPQVRIVGSIRS